MSLYAATATMRLWQLRNNPGSEQCRMIIIQLRKNLFHDIIITSIKKLIKIGLLRIQQASANL